MPQNETFVKFATNDLWRLSHSFRRWTKEKVQKFCNDKVRKYWNSIQTFMLPNVILKTHFKIWIYWSEWRLSLICHWLWDVFHLCWPERADKVKNGFVKKKYNQFNFSYFSKLRICVVDSQLNMIYHSFVKPKNPIQNYLTQYSGITKEMLEGVTTTLEDVQKAISDLLPSGMFK